MHRIAVKIKTDSPWKVLILVAGLSTYNESMAITVVYGVLIISVIRSVGLHMTQKLGSKVQHIRQKKKKSVKIVPENPLIVYKLEFA